METKTTKIARTDEGNSPADMLSSLPDEILTDILSFLPTKYAVGTAALSRRWKDLGANVSNIDFDNNLVYKPLTKQLACEEMQSDQALELFLKGINFLQPPERMKRYLAAMASRYRSLVTSILSHIQYLSYWDFSLFVDNVLLQHRNLHRVRRFRLHYDCRKPFDRRLKPDLWFYWFEKAVTSSRSELEQLDVKIEGKIDELPSVSRFCSL
ncbi:unnamed protein product [Linum trigynum]|uniref:F-box domain-containing protein n=1 Tax=Linum trigynum TaxID=586398 RepID=A0AAV2FGT0_9ROSI